MQKLQILTQLARRTSMRPTPHWDVSAVAPRLSLELTRKSWKTRETRAQVRFYSISEGDSDGILKLRNSLKAQNHLDAWPAFQNLSPHEVSKLNENDVGMLLSTFLKTDKVTEILTAIRTSHGGEGVSLADLNYVAANFAHEWTFGECIAFLRAMEAEGISPDISTFESIVTNLVARDPVGARKILEEEQPGATIPPTGKMYIQLASGFLRQGDPDAAAQTIQDMVACEIKPDEASLVGLLNELLSKGHEELATQIANMVAPPGTALPSFGSEGERP